MISSYNNCVFSTEKVDNSAFLLAWSVPFGVLLSLVIYLNFRKFSFRLLFLVIPCKFWELLSNSGNLYQVLCVSWKTSGHFKVSFAVTNLTLLIDDTQWPVCHAAVFIVVLHYAFIIWSMKSLFYVKTARNLDCFPVCSYESLLFINWIIKQSKGIFIISVYHFLSHRKFLAGNRIKSYS